MTYPTPTALVVELRYFARKEQCMHETSCRRAAVLMAAAQAIEIGAWTADQWAAFDVRQQMEQEHQP